MLSTPPGEDCSVIRMDLDSNPARHQETEDFPNEMPPGHCGCDSVGYAAQCGHTETGQLPIKEQLRLKRLQWFRHLQRMPDHLPQKQLLRCRLRAKKRRPGGTCLWWVDVISRDLTEIPQWQDVVTDRSAWRSAIHKPRSTQP